MKPTITYQHLPIRINNPGQRIVPREIILHYIGNPGTTAAANAKYFLNVNSRTSVHYMVDDSSIIEIIPPTMKSYGTNSKEHNEKGIQIEMCHPDGTGKINEATLKNVVWLCRELMGAFGITEIIRHYDVTGKRCPLWYVEHPEEWEELKKRMMGKELTLAEAKKIVQEKSGIDDNTMAFLDAYKFSEPLFLKLAQAMENCENISSVVS